MPNKDNLGTRMKENYEKRSRTFLTRRVPVIIRLDGKAFHTFTKGMKKPFDEVLVETMQKTTKFLCENIQGCKLGYTQSDEITLVLADYEKLNTEAWYDYNIQKIVSVSASMATLAFNRIFKDVSTEHTVSLFRMRDNSETNGYWSKIYEKYDKAMFDSRAFTLPKEEVANCFIWRQQDCTKNSISMVAQAHFSHRELHKKNGSNKQDMLMEQKGINWNDLPTVYKRGTCVKKVTFKGDNNAIRSKWIIDENIPIFTKNRDYIEQLI